MTRKKANPELAKQPLSVEQDKALTRWAKERMLPRRAVIRSLIQDEIAREDKRKAKIKSVPSGDSI